MSEVATTFSMRDIQRAANYLLLALKRELLAEVPMLQVRQKGFSESGQMHVALKQLDIGREASAALARSFVNHLLAKRGDRTILHVAEMPLPQVGRACRAADSETGLSLRVWDQAGKFAARADICAQWGN